MRSITALRALSRIVRHFATAFPPRMCLFLFSLWVLFGSAGAAEVPASAGVHSVDQPERDSTAKARRLLAEPFAEPRQLLQLLGIGTSELVSLVDGKVIGDEDRETLLKILYRMPQIGLDDIHVWMRKSPQWTDLIKTPERMRTSFISLHGRARRIERCELASELVSLFDFHHYYRVSIDVPASSSVAIVYTRHIPLAWQKTTELDERISASAMFLKIGAGTDDAHSLVFAAPRISWHPDRVERRFNVDHDQVLLGDLGLDVGLFDTVRARNRLPIDAGERECFYQLLAVLRGAPPSRLRSLAKPLQLGPLLQRPERQQGRLMHLRGTLRRIVKVVVEDADIQNRYQLKHYYQLDILVSLGKQTIEMRNPGGAGQGPLYRESFPITCCVTRLPPLLRPMVRRDQIRQPIQADGFFFKLWVFRNAYVAKFGSQQRQLSPLFVALEPQVQPAAQPSGSAWGWLMGAGFLVVLALIWGFVWRMNRSDRQARRKMSFGSRPYDPHLSAESPERNE